MTPIRYASKMHAAYKIHTANSHIALQIKSLQLEIMEQDIKTISTLSEFRLRESTRLNSNVRADLRELDLTTGAILLDKSDFVDFEDFKALYGSKDEMKGQFVIPVDDIRSRPEGVEDDVPKWMRQVIDGADVRVIVQFIYADHVLEGAAGTMRFRMTPTRMSKLDGLE